MQTSNQAPHPTGILIFYCSIQINNYSAIPGLIIGPFPPWEWLTGTQK
jgi:hypothetical protein